MKKLIPALIFGALLVPGAQGSITTYASRALYENALSSPTTFDFNSPDGPIFMLGPMLQVRSLGGPGADDNGRIVATELQASEGGLANPNFVLQFTFLQPGFAFGYDNLDLSYDEEAVITFSFVNGDPSQQYTINVGAQPEFEPVFFGAISTNAISQVQIYSRDIGSNTFLQRGNIIDNVTIGDVAPAVAPEPDSMMLMSGGFLLLLARAARMRLARARK